ncbi:helix-turn-helix domain-containing protein [Lacticaseibacillus manihotivorans]|uniref:HTH cro/C1-type domain-containing protein n=2 Tax=Lacticaseibacillus manihotivorans TaxID=88233 RepID=A0A0R1QPS8_9LACO|nr:helix-turn-helix transcriptional regulator [Lacticaseibacillus manihotivorans]KRL44266.1 hypothetical protein FD01_GL001207 [Lacticaseibacillus manihotivorans DSM 13343 = JCM 12514]QFQ92816.1 helix-turn-helix domain-containing protein [Lacticaseibacillus manihotivorans]
MTIGEQLQAARQAQQLTQQQVATQLHVARQTISNWETARSYPDITSLIALSDLYEVSLDQLLKSDAMLLADLKQKEQTRRTTKATYYLTAMIAYLALGIGLAHGWGFAAADMSPLVEYALILVVYLCIPVIFITGKRYRHAYHLANQMLQHRRSVIDLMIFTVGFGVVAQWAGWPEWIGLVSVAIIAGGLTYYWHRTDVHHGA